MTVSGSAVGPSWVDVRRHHRSLRRRRASGSVFASASSVYELLLYVAIGVGLLVSASGTLVDALALPASTPVRGWLCVAGAVAGFSTVFRALLGIGPLSVGPAPAAWLMSGPVDRGRFLRSRYLVVITAGAVSCGALALLMAVAGGAAGGMALLALDGLLLGVGLAALAVLAQVRPRLAVLLRRVSTVLVTASVLATAALVGIARRGPTPPALTAPDSLPVLLAAVLAAGAVGTSIAGWRALESFDRRSLVGGTAVVAAISISSNWMDATLVSGVVAERRLQRVATVRSRRHRRGRRVALIGADLHRILRSGPALAWWAGLLVLPYLVGTVGSPALVPLAQLVGVTVAVGRLAMGLRSIAGSRALRFAVGGSDRGLLVAHCAVPFAAGVLWTVLVSGAGGSPASLALLPVSAVAVVLRFATRPPRTYTSVLLDTPFGTLPVDTIREVSRGPVLFGVLAGIQLALA